MFSGGDYDEVARWLVNFVTAHAKRENTRAEAAVETGGARTGTSYGVRVRLGERQSPPAGEPPLELSFDEVASARGSLAWCDDLAARVRDLVRRLARTASGTHAAATA